MGYPLILEAQKGEFGSQEPGVRIQEPELRGQESDRKGGLDAGIDGLIVAFAVHLSFKSYPPLPGEASFRGRGGLVGS